MKKNLSYLLIGLLIGCLFPIQSILADQPIKLIINGKTIQCDVPPQNINGRVLVPARFVAEPLGAKVDWDGANNAVIISNDKTGNISQTNTNSFPEAENIKGNIKKVYINPTIKNNMVVSSQSEIDNGCFLMMYGKYSNMGNNFILLEGIYKAFPDIANDLKKDISQMEIRTYKNEQYVNFVNLRQFLLLHFETISMQDIDDNSIGLYVSN